MLSRQEDISVDTGYKIGIVIELSSSKGIIWYFAKLGVAWKVRIMTIAIYLLVFNF